ncbi:MAG: flagellin [Syntrophomonadaceae bacterium]
MIINHNMMAMNTYRQLSQTSGSQSKSMEKLSSGLRINRAGDDAAGLAISEKMRAQIAGLNMASKNSQDGISLIQTAEGALNETQSILQRMRELAVQASSDTNVTVDRQEIQKEINQLTSEINRIGNTTEFNTMKLLDGTRSESAVSKYIGAETGVVTVGAAKGVTSDTGAIVLTDNKITVATAAFSNTVTFGNISSAANSNKVVFFKDADGRLNVNISAASTTGETIDFHDTLDVTFTAGSYTYNMHNISFSFTEDEFADATVSAKTTIDLYKAKGANAKGDISTLNSFSANTTTVSTITSGITISSTIDKEARSLGIQVTAATSFKVIIKDSAGASLQTDTFKLSASFTAIKTIDYDNHGVKFTFKYNGTAYASVAIGSLALDTTQKTTSLGDQSVTFQVGANESQSMSLSLNDMTANALKVSSTNGGTDSTTGASYVLVKNVTNGTNNTATEFALDVCTQAHASKAITVINDAITNVSSERSKLGAIQNRLEHTIKNLDTSSENLQAAESRIRDVDMAKEMMNFTRQNILQQAATAMLAQANQSPQSVLQLLK